MESIDDANGKDENIIKEGKTKILKNKDVFYNKVQEFNRDLRYDFLFVYSIVNFLISSVLAIHTFLKHDFWKKARRPPKIEKVTILDALSATGLRSIRYSLECRQASLPIEIIANDILPTAIETIQANISYNNVNNVVSNLGDASFYMHQRRATNERVTVIDLDPYGSASPFLDAAVQAVENGGLLAITCTDMAVLAGHHAENCYAKYNSFPIKAKFCHESALRILLQAVQAQASKYGRYIEPLASFSIDFYVRIFVQVFIAPGETKKATSKLSYVVLCNGCESFELQPMSRDKSKENSPHFLPSKVMFERQCELCGANKTVSGPIWSAPIHKQEFMDKMKQELEESFKETADEVIEKKYTLGTVRRIQGLLQLASEELPDVPLYYQLDRLAVLASIIMPTLKQFRSALLNAGYRVSQSHAMKNAIKTNAPNSFIWAIVQKLAVDRNESGKWKETDRLYKLLTKDFSNVDISFELHPDALPKSQAQHMLRFQINPEDHWGPMTRPNKRIVQGRVRHKNKRAKWTENKKQETSNNEEEKMKDKELV